MKGNSPWDCHSTRALGIRRGGNITSQSKQSRIDTMSSTNNFQIPVRRRRWVSILQGLFCFVVCFILVIISTTQYLSSLRAENWPSVTGTVVSSEIKRGGGKHPYSKFYILYRYTIQGRTYTSDRFSYGLNPRSVPNGDFNVTQTTYKPGQNVDVFYNPTDPSEAVLQTRVNKYSFLVSFSAAILFFIIGILNFRKKKPRII